MSPYVSAECTPMSRIFKFLLHNGDFTRHPLSSEPILLRTLILNDETRFIDSDGQADQGQGAGSELTPLPGTGNPGPS
jgi:hypothetical protein